MKTEKFRRLSVNKVIAKMEADCGTVDLPELGMRKIDHHCKRASKLSNVYRFGRRNYLYCK